MVSDMDKIKVDINVDRIRESVEEIIRIINEYYHEEIVDRQKVIDQLNLILNSGKISVMFFLNMQNRKIPDLRMSVDPRKKKFLLRSREKFMIKSLNKFIRTL